MKKMKTNKKPFVSIKKLHHVDWIAGGRKQFKQISEPFEMRIQIISFVVPIFFCHLCDEPEGIGHEKKQSTKNVFYHLKCCFFSDIFCNGIAKTKININKNFNVTAIKKNC